MTKSEQMFVIYKKISNGIEKWFEKQLYYTKIGISAAAITLAIIIFLWSIATGFIFFGLGIFVILFGIYNIVDGNESSELYSGICGIVMCILGISLLYFCVRMIIL